MFLLSSLIILFELDSQLLDMKIAQVFLFYLHFLFFFFMTLNGYVYSFIMKILKPFSFFSASFLVFFYFLYRFYKNTFSYLNLLFFSKPFYEANIPIDPVLMFCEFYFVFVLLVIIFSVPSFFIYILLKKPMNLRNSNMIKKEYFWLSKITLIMLAPYNSFVFIPLTLSFVDCIQNYFRSSSKNR